MPKVVSIESARARQSTTAIDDYQSVGPFQSPVPNLIDLLVPMLNSIKTSRHIDVGDDLKEFLDVLELSRHEIDQLEDMARFLLEINRNNQEH